MNFKQVAITDDAVRQVIGNPVKKLKDMVSKLPVGNNPIAADLLNLLLMQLNKALINKHVEQENVDTFRMK